MASPSKVYNGKYATVAWGGNTVLNLTDWEVTITRDSADATPMVNDCADPDLRWNTTVPGGIGWTATANGYTIGTALDIGGMEMSDIAGTPADDGITVQFYFECATAASGYLEGTAFMTGSGFSASSTSLESVSYNFTGTGRLEYKTA